MARVSVLSAVLLIAVTTMGDQQPHNLYKVSLTQRGYIQASYHYRSPYVQETQVSLQQCFATFRPYFLLTIREDRLMVQCVHW
jgi:hypothetical protein